MLKKMLSMTTLCLFLSTAAKAGIMVEPYAGSASTVTSLDLLQSALTLEDETGSGSVYGARLGWKWAFFGLGAEYQSVSTDVDITTTSAYVDLELPILFRFYFKTALSSDVSGDVGSLENIEFSSGSAFGIGFTSIPFVTINFETFGNQYTSKLQGQDLDVAVAGTLLTVSVPLEF